MTLPFDGAISRYFREGAPKEVRQAIEEEGKDEIMTASYPYREEIKGKDYEDEQEAVKSLKEQEVESASPGTIGDLIKAQMAEK